MTSKPSLENQVAVITGAGRGIGRAIAIGYAQAGAAVVCAARTQTQVEQTVHDIQIAGGRASAFVADVADPQAMLELLDHAEKTWGGVDMVIVNAGVSPQNALVADSDPLLWKHTIDVNLTGAFNTAHAAIAPLKRRGGGKLLFIGSGMGHRSGPTRSAYAASKAGLWMLVRVLAQELVHDCITVNEIVPGPVETDFIAGRADALRAATGNIEWFKPPEALVPLALFLATQPKEGPTGQSFSLARREL